MKKAISGLIVLLMVSMTMLNVVALQPGPPNPARDTNEDLANLSRDGTDGTTVRSRSPDGRASPGMPDEALFKDPPKENRILPIYNGKLNTSVLDHFDNLGVGGLVVNSWDWDDNLLQHADGLNWTLWANDYYMYPSGNANKFGGLHDTFWNPGFENGSFGLWPDGWIWTYYDWPIFDKSGTESHSGTNAVSADAFNYYFWPLKIEGGWEYNISLWARGDTGVEAGRVMVLWYDVDDLIDLDISVFQTGANYKRFSVDMTAPANANSARILIMGHEKEKYVWFDDTMVRKTDQILNNSLTNPGFEVDADTNNEPDGWIQQNSANWDNSGVYSHSGSAAIRVNASDSYLQPINIVPGKEYYLGQWMRSETGTITSQIALLWIDNSWNIKSVNTRLFSINDTYTYHDIKVRAPLNSTMGLIACISAGNTYAYIDDVNFYPFKSLNNGLSRGPVLDGHPELEAQGLYYAFEDVDAPGTSNLSIPQGKLVSAVAAPIGGGGKLDLTSSMDVTSSLVGRNLQWTPTSGSWRVMAFSVDILYNGTEVDRSLSNMHQINVMNKVAVQRFIDEMYKKTIYDKTSQYWGDMILASFTDEVSNLAGYFLPGEPYPVVAWLEDDVNGLYLEDTFDQLHGYDIISYLPALWNDVGPRTSKYRVDFYNTTSYLEGQGYYKMIGDWCRDHGLNFSGHLLAEDSLIHHTAFYGDYFESIKHMGYPGMDTLLHSAGNLDVDLIVPKMVSSATTLYGKPHSMTEYSVSSDSMNLRNMTAIANWEAVQGIDTVTSFSFWIGVIPDADLIAHNERVGRTNYMLQQGRYTADIGVIYPITTIQAEYVPSTDILWNRAVFGGYEHDESFKNLTHELLGGQLDFIYINDESLNRTSIDNTSGETVLHHGISGLDLQVLVVPEMDVIKTETMERIRDFYLAGGIVVAVGDLPTESAENGSDPYITSLVQEVFDTAPVGIKGYNERVNSKGGVSIFADSGLGPLLNPLRTAMDPDLTLGSIESKVYYMKRTAPGFDMYFIVNNGDSDSSNNYSFKTLGDPYLWDPETGDVAALKGTEYSYDAISGRTEIDNVLIKGFSSIFLVFKRPILKIDVDDLVLDPWDPLEGSLVKIMVNVSNIGDGIAPSVKVKAFVGDDMVNRTQIGNTHTITISAKGKETLEYDWDTTDLPLFRNITVEACLPMGDCSFLTRNVFVNTPPWVNISVDPREALTFEPFDIGANISDLVFPIQNLSWDLGDANKSDLPNVTHEYEDDGIYTITLWVMDANGTTNWSSIDVRVQNRAPEANFSISPSGKGDAVTNFTFDASGSSDMDGEVVSYTWDFGDGSKGSDMKTHHTYSIPNNYSVSLTVEDDDGAKANYSMNITTENLAPEAGIDLDPTGGNVTTTFRFVSNSTDRDGEVVGFNWSFGDGTWSKNGTVDHGYSDDGTYEVSLRVVDDLGLWSPIVRLKVKVSNLAPVAVATPKEQTVELGDTASFSAVNTTDIDDDISILEFVWSWDDNTRNGKGVNASHIFTEPGIHNVTLTVTDDDGASSSVSLSVNVVKVEVPMGPKSKDDTELTGLFVLIGIIIVIAILLLFLRKRRASRPDGSMNYQAATTEQDDADEGPSEGAEEEAMEGAHEGAEEGSELAEEGMAPTGEDVPVSEEDAP